MNKQITRTIAGAAIIGVGVLALLNSLNVVSIGEVFQDWWPIAIIVAGILFFMNDPRNFIWPLILVTVGSLLQLRELDIISVNPWQLFWPLVIIAVGISTLVNRSHTHKGVNKKDLDDITALLAGSSTKNESKNYKGGKVSAILGGIEIDLREAEIKEDATLNVLTVLGGVDIKVPEGWEVKSTITPIAGGVEVKTKPTGKKAPVLTIVGDVVLGGVEIKN
ncbi:MAG TPA: DUF5668 domain-containing protein [Candidatus Saccharimonadales bacterium]